MSIQHHSIAVIIACYNEEATIANVVGDFRSALPFAGIYVYDNNSTDQSQSLAAAAGATVRHEPLQGKGHVIRRAFSDIEADIYVMVDGDATYPASHAPTLINRLLSSHLDMVVGVRRAQEEAAYRPRHVQGNLLFNRVVAKLFRRGMHDIFSGYRVFSRRFVKSFPAASTGFEIETELSIHALDANIPFAEEDVPYLARPEGSHSKLSTWRDGFRILRMVLNLYRQIKPLQLFGSVAALLFIAALILGWPLITVFLETGLVPRIPTAIIVMGLMAISVISLACGIILEGVSQARRENRRLHYLQHAPLK